VSRRGGEIGDQCSEGRGGELGGVK